MNNSKLKHNNRRESFLKSTSGSVAITMAIMLPAIFTCMAFSVNQAYTMRNRAQISEATNEASLAVIAIDNKNIDDNAKKENRQIALNFINYFISREIGDKSKTDADLLKNGSQINVDYNQDKKEYYISYHQSFDEFTNANHTDGNKNQPIIISNKQDSYGNTRKYQVLDSFDFVFVSDFSASSTCLYSDVNCNDFSPNNNVQRRLDYMKDAIVDIVREYENYSQFKFAFVPYDIGVPVASNTTNKAGGQNYDCSVMYKMIAPYDSVDYNFWTNKNIGYTKWRKLKQANVITDYLDRGNYFPNHERIINYYMDNSYYHYYSQIIGPAKGLPYGDNRALVDNGLCIRRTTPDYVDKGQVEYGCGTDQPDYPSAANKSIIENQYPIVVQLFDYMFSGDYNDVHYSFANTKTVDVQGTINTLFSGKNDNIITFNRSISPTLAEFSPFMGMCQSPLYSNNIMNANMISQKQVTDDMYVDIANGGFVKNFEGSPHLIPFSDNVDHNTNLLNEIVSSNWIPGGGTDTITALLRTVPVIAESKGNNKVIIIISDGKDDVGADVLRDNFLDNGVCQAITAGLRSEQNQNAGYIINAAKSAIIYYIKLNPNASNLTNDADYENEYGKWFTQCMNGNRMFLKEAQDRISLYDVINKIIEVETGKFIKKD